MADRQYVTLLGRPAVDKAFNGLRTITRLSRVTATGTQAASIEAEVFLAYGTADAEFANALLVKRSMVQASGEANAYELRLTEVYQEFTAGQKVSVGEDQVNLMNDGRTALVRRYVALASEAEGLAVAVGTALGSRACQDVKINKVGVGAEIIETYVSAGQISQSDSTGDQGKLLTRSITSVNVVPSTPAGYTLIQTDVNPVSGLPIYRYTYVLGEGLVQVSISPRGDGLRTETHVSYGTKSTPSGVVISDTYREADGYRTYTVTAMQTASGGSGVTSATLSFEKYVQFTYPGRAKAYSETVNGKKHVDVFRSPPVTTDVKATVTISYQTSNSLGTISDYWNPSEWATLRASWIGLGSSGDNNNNQVTALPGYRSVSATPVSETCAGVSPLDVSCMGNAVYGGTTAIVTVTGGPADPGGTTKTLDAWIEQAFTDTSGTVYYRKTLITAAIPAQSALPV